MGRSKGLKNSIWYKNYGKVPEVPCCWCGKMLRFKEATIDHEPPLGKGGSWLQAVISCYDCNQQRNKLEQLKDNGVRIMNNSIESFLVQRYPNNEYLDHPEWSSLYVRKADIGVNIGGKAYKLKKVFTFANIEAKEKGRGSFTRLVDWLVERGWAIHVECVHNSEFVDGLRRRGYLEMSSEGAPSFLFNYEGHLVEWKL
jgi:hypothetical protein